MTQPLYDFVRLDHILELSKFTGLKMHLIPTEFVKVLQEDVLSSCDRAQISDCVFSIRALRPRR